MPKQFNDGRHDISDKMIDNMRELAYSQDNFGINKYGKPLKAHYNYDWLKMAREELVDLGKYLECESERKDVICQMLWHGIAEKNWDLVIQAYKELDKDGTAK